MKDFKPAAWRGTTAVGFAQGVEMMGVSFDLEEGGTARLLLSVDDARNLAESINEMLAEAAAPRAAAEPGPWRTARVPHTREIMRALSAGCCGCDCARRQFVALLAAIERASERGLRILVT